MNRHGNFSGFVALLVLASLGLTLAGSALAPETLPVWLMAAGWTASWWALTSYRAAVRRRLDPRASESGEVDR
jgi:hypothetical protein